MWVGGIGAGQNLLPRGLIKGKEPCSGGMGPVSALNL